MFHRLITAEGQSRSAGTVEIFGWLILVEGASIVLCRNSPWGCYIFRYWSSKRRIISGSSGYW